MATPSGTISLSNVNTELGYSATALISMNDAAVRSLAGVPSGAISMQNLQNKSSIVVASLTIASNTSDYVLNTAKVPGYATGKTQVTLTINSGVYVSSSSTGSYAFTVDTSWATGDTLTVVNNGTIIGRGGDGGRGFWLGVQTGNPGGGGGGAINIQRATSINNVNRISGGGGGGGGAGFASFSQGKTAANGDGGGGGGGIGVSTGGAGGQGTPFPGSPGTPGTLTSAGGGGGSVGGTSGGSGGSYGASGNPGQAGAGGSGSGGAGGNAVVGNSNITWIATGTRNGGIS